MDEALIEFLKKSDTNTEILESMSNDLSKFIEEQNKAHNRIVDQSKELKENLKQTENELSEWQKIIENDQVALAENMVSEVSLQTKTIVNKLQSQIDEIKKTIDSRLENEVTKLRAEINLIKSDYNDFMKKNTLSSEQIEKLKIGLKQLENKIEDRLKNLDSKFSMLIQKTSEQPEKQTLTSTSSDNVVIDQSIEELYDKLAAVEKKANDINKYFNRIEKLRNKYLE